jgi:hypothetical protein
MMAQKNIEIKNNIKKTPSKGMGRYCSPKVEAMKKLLQFIDDSTNPK